MDPIESLLREVEKALDAKLYYLAIVLALTLPDVCSALEQPSGRTNDGLYRKWYKKHLKSKLGVMTPADCHSLRCGVLHQGKMGVNNQQFDRVIFTTAESPARMHSCVSRLGDESAMLYDAERFCREIIHSVREWFATAKDNTVVQANLPHLVQFRPHGLPPHFIGIPVIA